MKVSLKWLQSYFDRPLPNAEALDDAFTFHAFEVEEHEGDLIDVKVLPDRAGYALSHRGIAKELSAILDIPLKSDSLREPLESMDIVSPYLKVEIEDEEKCLRYVGAVVRGVKVGPSPTWLKEALESVGQRSINNVVDATNYVMLNVGQPLHAFDAAKLAQKDGAYRIVVRAAHEGERLTTLSGDELTLSNETFVIADGNVDVALAVAGVKGGMAAVVDETTTDLVVEAANFDGPTVRRAAQRLRLSTDSSLRFQNRPSPELAAYGMRDVLALITEIAGGEIEGVVDVYPARASQAPRTVSVTLERINAVLGASFTVDNVTDVFQRLGLPAVYEGSTFIVMPPFERTDLVISEDLVEEVGRIIGYDAIASALLPNVGTTANQARFRGIERMKDELVAQGFTEVSTQSFAKKGDIELANPMDKTHPFLRTSLEENLQDALIRAKQYAPLVLAPGHKPKLFEVGTVFPKGGEYLELRMSERVPAWGESAGTVDNLSVAKLEDYGRDYRPTRYELGAYKPFSLYPFTTRDIAFWAPADTDEGFTKSLIQEKAGELLVRIDQFDRFEKEGRVSLAFRLVFQSFERTLTDEEVNGVMEKVSEALTAKDYEVR